MRILIYGLNYAPELTGVGKYTGELACWLASRGHEVRVVTALPYYPDWRVDKAYRHTLYRVESGPDATTPRVYRCPLWVPAKPTGLSRMVHLFSFAISSLPVMATQTLWKPQVVFSVEPTLFVAPVALLSATVVGAVSWLHVQDLEVDAAFKNDILPADGRLQSLARTLESVFTSGFSRVSSISAKMVERIVAKGVARADVVLFPNWGDVDSVKRALPGAENIFRDELRLKGKIVFLYSGTMGVKQGLWVLASLAKLFCNDARVHFVFCGEGSSRSELQKLVRDCTNVTMLPLLPTNRLNDLLNFADIHLLPQKRDVDDLALPSKLAGILASGRPVIATVDADSEVANMVDGCGLVVPAEDPEALYEAARRLVDNPDLRASLGLVGREYAVKNLSKERLLRRFEREIITLVEPPKQTGDVQLARSYRG